MPPKQGLVAVQTQCLFLFFTMINSTDAKNHLQGLNNEDNKWHKDVKYKCPACFKESSFDVKEHDPFPAEVEREFNEAMGEINIYEEDFCNFYCQHCLQPVRILSSIVEFHYSSYYYYPQRSFVYTGDYLYQLQDDQRQGNIKMVKGKPVYKKSLWSKLFG